MDDLLPEKLTTNRVYFTELDRITYSQVAWTPSDVDEIKRALSRKLKLLAITKGHILIAASHLLESELARELILPYPELFSERIIVPALRSDFTSCGDFLDAKKASDSPGEQQLYQGDEQRDMAQLIDSTALVVRWNSSDTSGWFKNRLLSDIRNQGSLVSARLQERGLILPSKLEAEIESAPILSRGVVYQATKRCNNLALQEIVGGYADFIYYLSGARAVHSEGVLPQENLVDFHISELNSEGHRLSEYEVFFKVFVDTVKANTSAHFPADLLDALSMTDAISLHHLAMQSQFVEKYNAIQQKTKEGLAITDPERLVLLMEELLIFEEDLHRAYALALDSEMPSWFRQTRTRAAGAFLNAIASLVVLPYGALVDTTNIIVTGLRVIKRDHLASGIQLKIQDGLRFLESLTMQIEGFNKPVLLEFVDRLKARYELRMSGIK
ncbi:MAG TPA: hypothetical protein PK263_05355 [bacterium]|nr:hypothetical protein [bacterium]